MARLPVTPVLLLLTFGAGAYIAFETFKALGGKTLDDLKTLPLFAFHPILMVASWLFFAPLSWSLILLRKETLIKSKRILLTQMHAASMFLAVVCWATALFSIFMHKQQLGKEHFQSPHSMVGVSVAVLIVLSYAPALTNVMDLKSKEKVNFNWNSKIHKTMGKVALVMSGLAISTGLFTRWGKTTFEDKNLRTGLALCIIVPQLMVALDVTTRFAGDEEGKKKGK